MVRTRGLMQIAVLLADENICNKLLNLPKILVSLMRMFTHSVFKLVWFNLLVLYLLMSHCYETIERLCYFIGACLLL